MEGCTATLSDFFRFGNESSLSVEFFPNLAPFRANDDLHLDIARITSKR